MTLAGYEKYLTLLQTILAFGFSQAKPREIEHTKLDCIKNCLTDNSSKFSDYSNSIPAWL